MNPIVYPAFVLLGASAIVLGQAIILIGDWMMGHREHERPRSRGVLLLILGACLLLAGVGLLV